MKRPHFLHSLLLRLTPWRRKSRRYTALSTARRRRTSGAGDGDSFFLLEAIRQIHPARVALAIGTAVALSLLLCIHLWPNRVNLSLGDRADREIIAQRTVRYEDTSATRQLRTAAQVRVKKRYDPIPDASAEAVESARAVFDISARWAIRDGAVPDADDEGEPGDPTAEFGARLEAAIGEIRQQGTVNIPTDAVALLMRLDTQTRMDARAVATELVERYMSGEIRDDGNDLAVAKEKLAADPELKRLKDPKLRAAVVSAAGSALLPNQRYNPRLTAHDQQTAVSAVRPQIRRIAAGAAVIKAGETVTQQHLDAFAALGLQNARLDMFTVATVVALVVALVGAVGVYLRLFHRGVYDDTPRLFLLALLVILSVAGLKVGQTLLGLQLSGVHFGYLGMMCVASAGMAIAVLICPSVALLVVSLLSVLSGLVLNNELRFTVITLGSSMVGIISVATLRHRGDFVRATLMLCGANAALNALVGLLEGDLPQELMSGAMWGVVSGLFALALFYTGVAVLERWFGITTHLRLLEMTDPARPILQEFRLRVPGTYAHSLMVANLAHAAAEAIGADELLVRVAAYYHDLGKMNRPEFFIENQSNAENIHDRLTPYMSALVLTSHVKEGMEMAAAEGLPRRVLDVIEQHHGTSLIKFFYHRATGGRPDPSLEAQFRYPGPKPQTKEAAIVMLADTVEAASRTLERPTPQRISDFVATLIEEKRADGQLDECDLTLRDLKTIQGSFVRTLSATLHARVAYPGQKSEKAGAAAEPAETPPAAAAAPPPLRLTTYPEEALQDALRAAAPVASLENDGTLAADDDAPGRDAPAAEPRERGRPATTRGRR